MNPTSHKGNVRGRQGFKEVPADPFLDALDRLQQTLFAQQEQLNALRDAYMREREDGVRLPSTPPSEYLTARQVGNRFGYNNRTVLAGENGFKCLNRARIKDGGSVRYPARLVEIHERNRLERGKCGTCDVEFRSQFPGKAK